MRSDSIDKLAGALAAAQAEIADPLKSKTAKVQTKSGGNYTFDYASLADGLDVCRKVLPKHGLSYVQTTDVERELFVLTTTLLHSSGQWIASRYPVRPTENTPQGLGSALTYARRYALFALVGIAPEDDDGNEGSGNHAEVSTRRPTASASKPQNGNGGEPKHAAWVRKAEKEIEACRSQEAVMEWERKNTAGLDRLAEVDKAERERLGVIMNERYSALPSVINAG